MTWTSDRYARFARDEAGAASVRELDWARGIASDDEVLELLDTLPVSKRQPNLQFAVHRMLGAPPQPWREHRVWLLGNWDDVAQEAGRRTVQTNEPGRLAMLLPVLAALPQPLALIEVGAAAGLTLLPDAYAYRYGGRALIGASELVLETEVQGPAPVPRSLPRVAWRRGIDLHPLDVRRSADVAWLEALTRPGQPEGLARLRAAVRIAREQPERLEIVAGDAARMLPALVAQAPRDATAVVVTSGVLVYLDPEHRMRVVAAIRAGGARWVALEAAEALEELGVRLPPRRAGEPPFVLALDGEPLAWAGPHGESLHWFGRSSLA